ncbi:hypothetical protein OHA21_15630 [Actinoplanes sp. NBC_00393]|uniref:hypothetical protein n=1 Tax=Actinoplanes sp. NBC_00393 TaxID=2975953 RepID=UPI002E1C893F
MRLLAEREAAARAEWLRLEQEAAQITGLIEECRREIERLAITREVLSGLVTVPEEPVPAVPGRDPVGDFGEQLLVVLADAARPMRCREVVAVLGEDPSVARHGERVRHRLKKLAAAGLVREVEPGLFARSEDSGSSPGVTRPEWRRRGGGLPGWPGFVEEPADPRKTRWHHIPVPSPATPLMPRPCLIRRIDHPAE